MGKRKVKLDLNQVELYNIGGHTYSRVHLEHIIKEHEKDGEELYKLRNLADKSKEIINNLADFKAKTIFTLFTIGAAITVLSIVFAIIKY